MPNLFRIKKNIITKKASRLNTENNCYSFVVDAKANRIEIKKNIEKSFSVKVKSVNTVCCIKKVTKKYTNNGVVFRKPANFKKAYVYLEKGEYISFDNFLK